MVALAGRILLEGLNREHNATPAALSSDATAVEQTATRLSEGATPSLGCTPLCASLAQRLRTLLSLSRQSNPVLENGATLPSDLPGSQGNPAVRPADLMLSGTALFGVPSPSSHPQSANSLHRFSLPGRTSEPSLGYHPQWPESRDIPNRTMDNIAASASQVDPQWHDTATSQSGDVQHFQQSQPPAALGVASSLHDNPYFHPPLLPAPKDNFQGPSRTGVFDEPSTLLAGQESWPPAFLSWLANSSFNGTGPSAM
jgi:hypothetical protein